MFRQPDVLAEQALAGCQVELPLVPHAGNHAAMNYPIMDGAIHVRAAVLAEMKRAVHVEQCPMAAIFAAHGRALTGLRSLIERAEFDAHRRTRGLQHLHTTPPHRQLEKVRLEAIAPEL